MNCTPTNAARKNWIRPAWTPVTITMTIIGFMITPVLGLAMLAYIIWGDRLDEVKDVVREKTSDIAARFGRDGNAEARWVKPQRTGNMAFDEWRDGEIERLREERRRLDEAREEFDAYLRELQRARDEEEFEAFKASRRRKSALGPREI